MHIVSVLLGAVALSLVFAVVLAIYRVFFHPLAKYPGPLLAKITDAHQLYHAWKGDRHLEFWRMHEQYGNVVRFGPNSVSFNSSAALRDIYGFKSNVRKAAFYDAFAHPVPNTHNTRDKATHARKRRVLSQAFSDGAIKGMERYILANVRAFCEQIGPSSSEQGRGGDGVVGDGEGDRKGWSLPRNMADWCNYLAMDILGDLCFGKAFHMLEQPDNRYALELVSLATTRHLICGTMRIVEKLGLDKVLFRHIAAGRARYMVYSRGQLADRTRLGDDTDRRDFFYHLLRARDPETGQGFAIPELWAESNLLIIAGSDTTSTALAATFFYLARSPAALRRAADEVRAAFAGAEDVVQGPALASCAYLRACVDEAMRMSPSVGGVLPREVLPGGLTVHHDHQEGGGGGGGGDPLPPHRLPAGTVVGVPHYAIHHNPAYYPEPFAYKPERWLASESKSDVARAQAAFCPFSVGPRGCIGKGLAYAEMTTALARVLLLYDLRSSAASATDPGQGGRAGAEWGRHRAGEYQLVDQFTSRKDGPMVEFRRRVVGT
ncbi:isotrichodermin C-15 hydroxylase [Xylariaceae sp. FL0804]|nr:isotrichodermin C-15 hydroxylase [Xylariaceae sp. FL0804]